MPGVKGRSGRKAYVDQSVRKHVYIPQSLVDRIEPQLIDPLTDRLRHGAWSDLITKLLRGYVADEEAKMEEAEGLTVAEIIAQHKEESCPT